MEIRADRTMDNTKIISPIPFHSWGVITVSKTQTSYDSFIVSIPVIALCPVVLGTGSLQLSLCSCPERND